MCTGITLCKSVRLVLFITVFCYYKYSLSSSIAHIILNFELYKLARTLDVIVGIIIVYTGYYFHWCDDVQVVVSEQALQLVHGFNSNCHLGLCMNPSTLNL